MWSSSWVLGLLPVLLEFYSYSSCLYLYFELHYLCFPPAASGFRLRSLMDELWTEFCAPWELGSILDILSIFVTIISRVVFLINLISSFLDCIPFIIFFLTKVPSITLNNSRENGHACLHFWGKFIVFPIQNTVGHRIVTGITESFKAQVLTTTTLVVLKLRTSESRLKNLNNCHYRLRY